MPDFVPDCARRFSPAAPLIIALTMMTLAFVLVFSTGCQSSPRHESWQITARDLRRDMSPTLKTLAQTSDQHATTKARVSDLNMRMIHHDMDTVLLQNRPSYLTAYPVP